MERTVIRAMSLLLILGPSALGAESTIKPKWSVPTNGDTGWCSPAIGPDGTIYIGDISGRLRAVNPDGGMKWTVRIAKNLSGSSPVLTADGTRLYIGEMASPGRMFCVRTTDAKVLWAYELPRPAHLKKTPNRGQKLGGGINSSPAISYDGNSIYFGSGIGSSVIPQVKTSSTTVSLP